MMQNQENKIFQKNIKNNKIQFQKSPEYYKIIVGDFLYARENE